MNISEKIQQLKEIEDQHTILRGDVLEAVKNITEEIGDNPALERHEGNVNSYTIKFSDIVGTPFSPHFHDWKYQAELLVGLLEKKPVTDWKSLIIEWAKGAQTDSSQIVVDKVQLNTEFLRKVAEKM